MSRIFLVLSLLSMLALAATPVAEHTVTQAEKAFSQTEITIKPGDKVTFKNADQVTHNVFSISKGNEFNLKTQAPGASSSVPFNTEGVAEIRCAIHPKMKLIVNIKR